MKRLLISLHRYLGAVLCLPFAVWFASGIVMVFVGFPHLDEDRRLRALSDLVADPSLPTPAEVFARTPVGGRVRLGMLGARAVYRFVDGTGQAGLVDAKNATAAVVLDPTEIARLATAHVVATDTAALSALLVDRRDQWTTMVPAASQFPLSLFDAHDAAGSQVYVSLRTAEVVQVTTRRERLLAWVGAIPHWIYPIVLRRHAEVWRFVVIALAGCGALLCLSGLVIGFWHWRPIGRRFRGTGGVRTASPYRGTWMRWHHYIGLCFGSLAFTWVGSGALSLNPFQWSTGSSPSPEEEIAFAGGPLQIESFRVRPGEALGTCRREIRPRELELVQIGGRPYYLCRQSSRESRLVAADISRTVAVRFLATETVLAAGASVWSGRPIVDAAVMQSSDGYFATDDSGVGSIMRIRVGEKNAIWYYVDLRTGKIVMRLTPSGRLERWLYHGFHSLDFPFLRPHSAMWYVIIVGLCAVGLFFSVTGVAVTTGWLARVGRRRGSARSTP